MPVKARQSKQRRSSRAEIEAWGDLFECEGFDFFGDLEDFGYTFPWIGHIAPRADLEKAWHHFGRAWLAIRPPHCEGECWALKEFGPPCR